MVNENEMDLDNLNEWDGNEWDEIWDMNEWDECDQTNM